MNIPPSPNICYIFYTFTKLDKVAILTHGPSEVFDPNIQELKCTRLPRDEFDNRTSAVGGLIEQMPIICGGVMTKSPDLTQKASDWSELKTYIDTCSILENGTSWKTIKMWQKRKDATIVALNSTTLWILGGKTIDSTGQIMAGLEWL